MDATQIILIVFIVLLIIIYPIMISSRNKKENQRMQEQTNSLKRGDRVLTTSGVYGTIIDLPSQDDKKIVTIETGTDNKKGYIAVDAYAIYTVFKDEDEKKEEDKKVENKVEKADKEKSKGIEEAKKDETIETIKEETQSDLNENVVTKEKGKRKKK